MKAELDLNGNVANLWLAPENNEEVADLLRLGVMAHAMYGIEVTPDSKAGLSAYMPIKVNEQVAVVAKSPRRKS